MRSVQRIGLVEGLLYLTQQAHRVQLCTKRDSERSNLLGIGRSQRGSGHLEGLTGVGQHEGSTVRAAEPRPRRIEYRA